MPSEIDEFITKFGGWTESYWFYDHTIELRFAPKEHVYYLVTPTGLEPQAGVTNTCHIIDKSEALVPWACKMMAQKLLVTSPRRTIGDNSEQLDGMPWADYEKLITNAKTAHKERLEEAGIVGNLAHNWIEGYIKLVLSEGTNCPLAKLQYLSQFPSDQRAANCCVAALDWMQRHNVEWVETESKIYSRVHQYAGTMDGLCYCDSCDNPSCCPTQFTRRLSVADWKSSNYLYMEYMLQTAAYQAAYEEEHGVFIEDRWVIRLGKDDGEFEPWHMERKDFHEDFTTFIFTLDLTRAVESIKARIKTKENDKRSYVRMEKAIAKEEARQAEIVRKAQVRADKKQARLDALKVKCKGAVKYKGIRSPKCNKGFPCQSCVDKYKMRQANVVPEAT
jgi:hypothetical protein